MDQVTIHGFISLNLFSVWPSHSLCQFCLMNDFTASYTSEYGTGEFNGLHACLTALSAALLSFIPHVQEPNKM